ncbi:MAG: glucose-1-phosphate adenylyltransferase [Anaeroplasmataceae bacterium]|nr:glucose-1-phosphate adenylyltransferase [Anaeroplasmataceae bacterium]MDE5867954.1 glucose-1-phosphate adenylyltransferase [Anaeroplasmataceae bacterium]
METLALILAGGRGSRLDILSERRSKPAVPFAGKFRIIDFALSNCCNSGIFQIGILTQYLPLSLNEHIGVGKPWDLDRRDSFVTLLQPNNSWYEGTADAIRKNIEFVKRYASKYVLILSGDHIYKMDYSKMIEQHKQTGADLTIAAKIVPIEEASRFGVLETDSNLKINKFVEKPKEPKSNKASMGIYVFSTQALIDAIEAHPDIVDLDFGKHIIPDMINDKNVYAYEYYDYWMDVGTYDSYLDTNLELCDNCDLDLYDPSWKIYTKSEDLPPVKVGTNAEITKSLISNGCKIEGTVNHSVISPGVVVGEGSDIVDSIILNDVVIGKNCHIERAIIDKETVISDNSIIGTGKDYTPNKDKPNILSSGLNVIGKKLILPEGLVVERNVRIFSSTNPKTITTKHIASGETLK